MLSGTHGFQRIGTGTARTGVLILAFPRPPWFYCLGIRCRAAFRRFAALLRTDIRLGLSRTASAKHMAWHSHAAAHEHACHTPRRSRVSHTLHWVNGLVGTL